jgi:tetratricopeptide (TPR) repeat protein
MCFPFWGIAAGLLASGLVDGEIERLEATWRTSSNPDSVRAELALALRTEGSLEHRLQALDHGAALYAAHPEDRRVAWDYAQTLLDCARPSLARAVFAEMVARDSLDLEARSAVARYAVGEMLRHYDFGEIEGVLDLLEGSRRIDPANAENLLFTSFVCYLATKAPKSRREILAGRGVAWAEEAIALDPHDLRGRLLRAVHLTELGRWDEADLEFQATLPALPPGQRAVFEGLPPGVDAALQARWEATPEEVRPQFAASVWRGRDPSPLTPVDENRIEFWSRAALVDFLYGIPPRDGRGIEGGTPGWVTDPGRAFLRYGFPTQNVFSTGAMEDLASEMESHPWKRTTVGATQLLAFDFYPPSWTWRYEFAAGPPIELVFEDVDFQGTFRSTDDTAKLLAGLETSLPAIFDGARPGGIQRIFARWPAFAGTDSTTVLWLDVALPPWVTPREPDWWRESTLELAVRDRAYQTVATRKRRIDASLVGRPTPSGEVVLASERFELPPGDYWVESNVVDARLGEHGSMRRPVTVRRFGAVPFEVSDLRLMRAATADSLALGAVVVPNPLGWVEPGGRLQVSYEVYAPPGTYALMARYTILPRTYLLTIRELIRRGELRADDPRALGELGMRLGSVLLSRTNYSDVLFPAETVTFDGAARAPRGAALDVSVLDPGEYAVVATLTDLVTGASASAVTPIRVVAAGELAALLDPAPRR